MAKYSDLLSQAMGVGSDRQGSVKQDKKGPAISVPFMTPDAVSQKTYEPFSEESEMESYEDAADEEGNFNLGATTGDSEEDDLDELIRLKLEALGRIK